MVRVPEPERSEGPRPTRRSPSRAGIGVFLAFSSGSRRTSTRETYVATRFSPIPNNTAAATSDSQARINPRRTHPRLVRDDNSRRGSRTRGRKRARIPGVAGNWHSPAWLRLRVAPRTHRRYCRGVPRVFVPIPNRITVARTRARDIRPRSPPRPSTSSETIRVSCAIWSRTREVDRHFVNQTCFFALPTPAVLPSCNARAPSRCRCSCPRSLFYANRARPRREASETRRPIGRGIGGDGSRGTRAHPTTEVVYRVCVYVRVRARPPEKRLLN